MMIGPVVVMAPPMIAAPILTVPVMPTSVVAVVCDELRLNIFSRRLLNDRRGRKHTGSCSIRADHHEHQGQHRSQNRIFHNVH